MLLAAPSTPEPARDAVLDFAAKGEHLTHAQVKHIIETAKRGIVTGVAMHSYAERGVDPTRRRRRQRARSWTRNRLKERFGRSPTAEALSVANYAAGDIASWRPISWIMGLRMHAAASIF